MNSFNLYIKLLKNALDTLQTSRELIMAGLALIPNGNFNEKKKKS